MDERHAAKHKSNREIGTDGLAYAMKASAGRQQIRNGIRILYDCGWDAHNRGQRHRCRDVTPAAATRHCGLALPQRCIKIGPITAFVLQGTLMIVSDHKPQALKWSMSHLPPGFFYPTQQYFVPNVPSIQKRCRQKRWCKSVLLLVLLLHTIDWKVTTYSISMILLPSDTLTTTTYWRQHTTTYKRTWCTWIRNDTGAATHIGRERVAQRCADATLITARRACRSRRRCPWSLASPKHACWLWNVREHSLVRHAMAPITSPVTNSMRSLRR